MRTHLLFPVIVATATALGASSGAQQTIARASIASNVSKFVDMCQVADRARGLAQPAERLLGTKAEGRRSRALRPS